MKDSGIGNWKQRFQNNIKETPLKKKNGDADWKNCYETIARIPQE